MIVCLRDHDILQEISLNFEMKVKTGKSQGQRSSLGLGTRARWYLENGLVLLQIYAYRGRG